MKLILNVPSGISERTRGNVPEFMYSLKDEWDGFNGPRFIEGLELIGRRDLLANANNITWLCSESVQSKRGRESKVAQFVNLLLNEMLLEDWRFIVQGELSIRTGPNLDIRTAFSICIDNDVIDPPLNYFCQIMELIGRNDLVKKVQQFKTEFEMITEAELKKKLKIAMRKDKK